MAAKKSKSRHQQLLLFIAIITMSSLMGYCIGYGHGTKNNESRVMMVDANDCIEIDKKMMCLYGE